MFLEHVLKTDKTCDENYGDAELTLTYQEFARLLMHLDPKRFSDPKKLRLGVFYDRLVYHSMSIP